jgi:hypothetical protein
MNRLEKNWRLDMMDDNFKKKLKGETAGLDEDNRANTAARWRFSP